MDYIKTILSSNLIELRKSKGLKQKELAEAAGISVTGYNRWENGLIWPDPASLEKLAIFYNVQSSRFFYDPTLKTNDDSPLLSKSEIKKSLLRIIDSLDGKRMD